MGVQQTELESRIPWSAMFALAMIELKRVVLKILEEILIERMIAEGM